MNRDKLRPGGPLGLYADFPFFTTFEDIIFDIIFVSLTALKFVGVRSKYLCIFFRYDRKSLDIFGYRRKSSKTFGNPWKFSGNVWKHSSDLQKTLEETLKISRK